MAAQRNTVQKNLVRKALCDLFHPTAEEIYRYVRHKQPSISKATLYRNLKSMADQGTILRIGLADGAARYDDTTRPHYHGRCRRCGRIFDIELDDRYAEALQSQVTEAHGFLIEDQEILFVGRCPSCQI